jgi:hypothetical protein
VSAGEIVVDLSLTGFVGDRQRVVMRPGSGQSVELVAYDGGGIPRKVRVFVEVRGAVCPDPNVHAALCHETRVELYGDCDGDVRAYLVRAPASTQGAGIVAGKAPGEHVLLCAAHAQTNGHRIRKAPK